MLKLVNDGELTSLTILGLFRSRKIYGVLVGSSVVFVVLINVGLAGVRTIGLVKSPIIVTRLGGFLTLHLLTVDSITNLTELIKADLFLVNDDG